MQNKQLKILGLTGGIAAGKSIVSVYLKKLGGYIFDCDKIAHNVMLKGNEAYDEIRATIQGDYLGPKCQIDRKKLGEIVFYDSEKLKRLEAVVHKAVGKAINRKIRSVNNSGYRFIVIDAPLLLQSDIKNICDEVWIVDASVDNRAIRLMKRNGLTMEEALHRISIQTCWETIDKDCFIVINNEYSLKELKRQVKIRLKEFL